MSPLPREDRASAPECVALHVGVWNEGDTDKSGSLLYDTILKESLAHGISGATAWNSIEGFAPGGRFRSVENEVSSNSLPLWITMLDSPSRILQFARVVAAKVEDKGIVCSEPVEWLRVSRSSPSAADSAQTGPGESASKVAATVGSSCAGGAGTLGGAGADANRGAEAAGTAGHERTAGVGEPARVAGPAEPARVAVSSGTGGDKARSSTSNSASPATEYAPARGGLHVQAFMLEKSRVDGKPVYQALAELMRHHGVLWVSTTRGLSGYGEGRKMRGRGWFGKQMDVPITMHIVDAREKLEPILPEATRLVGGEALLTVTEVALYN